MQRNINDITEILLSTLAASGIEEAAEETVLPAAETDGPEKVVQVQEPKGSPGEGEESAPLQEGEASDSKSAADRAEPAEKPQPPAFLKDLLRKENEIPAGTEGLSGRPESEPAEGPFAVAAETVKPADAVVPMEAESPAGTITPAEAEKPAGIITPAEAENPAGIITSAEAESPAGTTAPAEAEKPAGTAASAEAEKPAVDPVKEETDKPLFIPQIGSAADGDGHKENAEPEAEGGSGESPHAGEPSGAEPEADVGEDDDQEEEGGRLSLMKPTKGVFRILVAGVLLLAVILIYALIQSRRVYSSYEVMSVVSNVDDASASYQVNRNGMIRYSNNGIALTDKTGNVIWNQTYEMNNPIIACAGNYIAAGDRGASTLFIFNQYGQCGKLTTDLPIQGMQIAENGVTAAILSDSESNYINMYDKQGNRLVSIRATLENTGYPLTVGISPDAAKLVVSYISLENEGIKTKVVFYDFSSTTGEHEKRSGTMDELCPKIQFLGDQRVAVFREKGFDIFSIEGEIKMVSSIEFEDAIRSVFADEQRLGFLFRNGDENGKYRLELYDVSGQKSMTIYTDLDYTDLRADSDQVVLFNNNRAEIYKFNGKQVFGGDFENRVTALMPSWDAGMYWLVEDTNLSEIRVK